MSTGRDARAALLERLGGRRQGTGSAVAHFGDAADELRAALERCAVSDAEDLARIEATGPDILDLLNRLSTNDVSRLRTGQGCATVLTSPKGRVVQRLLVTRLGDRRVLLIAGAGCAAEVIRHLDRYTFAENTGLQDRSRDWSQVAIVGPRAGRVLDRLGIALPAFGHGIQGEIDGVGVTVLGHDGLGGEGASLLGETDGGERVLQALAEAAGREGGRLAGTLAMEARRVLLGIPASGRELTEERNPLEAGLRHAVDFGKGCYVGQEVVARLNTYDKVARHLKGLRFPDGADCPVPGAAVRHGERSAGVVSSALVPPGWSAPVALAYVRRGFSTAGTGVRVGDAGTVATVSDLPMTD